jgi:hypothetical protein
MSSNCSAIPISCTNTANSNTNNGSGSSSNDENPATTHVNGIFDALAKCKNLWEFILYIWYNPWILIIWYNFGLW